MKTARCHEQTHQLRKARRWAPPGRTLHLIDLENLIGGSTAEGEAVRAALASYRRRLGIREGDLIVIAASPLMAFEAKAYWSGALVRTARGVDGADIALLTEGSPEELARRFDRVVIASGDGIFAALATDLREREVSVAIASRPGALSGALRRVPDIKLIPLYFPEADLGGVA
jgi:hypothetical protein